MHPKHRPEQRASPGPAETAAEITSAHRAKEMAKTQPLPAERETAEGKETHTHKGTKFIHREFK